nr:MAG TPA_asm: hypothetical protein [Microviridae sp.]
MTLLNNLVKYLLIVRYIMQTRSQIILIQHKYLP